MRPDYCPVGNEPCQSLCDEPCTRTPQRTWVGLAAEDRLQGEEHMKPWSIEECEAYAKQLKDKTRANTAEHAAQAIEYLLGLVRREEAYKHAGHPLPEREWVALTDEEIETIWRKVEAGDFHDCVLPFAEKLEARLKEKNT